MYPETMLWIYSLLQANEDSAREYPVEDAEGPTRPSASRMLPR